MICTVSSPPFLPFVLFSVAIEVFPFRLEFYVTFSGSTLAIKKLLPPSLGWLILSYFFCCFSYDVIDYYEF